MFTFSRADLLNLRSLQSCFFTLWPNLVRGGQEPEPRVPRGNEPGPGLLHCSRWILDPARSWFLQTLKGVKLKLPRWGSENTSRVWQHLRGFQKLCTRFLFCFVHRPLKEAAVPTSKGSPSHSPPMSCQEPVMAQVHPQHPSLPLGQSPSFPTCGQLSQGQRQRHRVVRLLTTSIHFCLTQ